LTVKALQLLKNIILNQMKNALKDCYQNAGDGDGSWKVPKIKKYFF
jgi:hypothetical protein